MQIYGFNLNAKPSQRRAVLHRARRAASAAPSGVIPDERKGKGRRVMSVDLDFPQDFVGSRLHFEALAEVVDAPQSQVKAGHPEAPAPSCPSSYCKCLAHKADKRLRMQNLTGH